MSRSTRLIALLAVAGGLATAVDAAAAAQHSCSAFPSALASPPLSALSEATPEERAEQVARIEARARARAEKRAARAEAKARGKASAGTGATATASADIAPAFASLGAISPASCHP